MSGLTMTDLFCGAGGSSTGAQLVPGVTVRLAANHWPLAVETHNTNHPAADHDCADLSQVDPRRYPATDILWASPECTNHSIAKGRRTVSQASLFDTGDGAAERSRATMWDVVRFAEHHRYRLVFVENVVDVRDWALFPAWLVAMDALGYCVHQVFLNSMFAGALGAPAPQSRDRWYALAHRRGDRCPDLDRFLRPAATCTACGRDARAVQAWKRPDRRGGKYRAQYVWRCPAPRCHAEVHPAVRPAADAIDWTLPAQRIADRERPLAERTMARIRAGIARYWATPQLVPAGGTWRASASPVTAPMPTRTTRESDGLLVPVEGRDGKNATSAGEPMRTCTTRNETGLAVPFVAELRGGGSTHRPVTDPLATVCASGNHHGLVTPAAGSLVVPYYGTGVARPATEPAPTVTTVDRAGLACGPAIVAEDCGFRMLTPAEYAAAMAFPGGYVLLGTKREQVRMAGNAVTPPAARDLIAAGVAAITGEAVNAA